MPNLPVYDSQQSIAAQSTGPQPVAAMGAQNRVLSSIGETMAKIGDKWHRAQVLNQTTFATNERAMAINNLMADADAELDHNKKSEYFDRLEKMAGVDAEINDSDAKARFGSDSGLMFDTTRIKMDGMFKQKLVSNQLVEIGKDGDISRMSYITSQDPAKRALDLQAYKERLKVNLDSGILSQKMYESEMADTATWDYDRAMSDASVDLAGTAKRIEDGEYDVSMKEKNELISTIKSTVNRKNLVLKIDTLTLQGANEDALLKSIYGERSESPIELIQSINELQGKGEVSEDFASNARRYLKGIGSAKSDTNEVARFYGLIHDANQRLGDSSIPKKNEQYLLTLQKLRNNILSSGRLNGDDKSRLQREIISTTRKRQASATQNVFKSPRIKPAHTYFRENLPPMLQAEAVRKYLYATSGKDLSPEDSAKAMLEIKNEVRLEGSAVATERYAKVRQFFGDNYLVDFKYDKDKGKYYYEITSNKGGEPMELPLDSDLDDLLAKKRKAAKKGEE